MSAQVHRRLLFLPGLLDEHLLHHAALQHQLILQLRLLSLRELRQFLNDVLAVFETESSNDFPSLAITLRLRNIVVFVSHVHVAGRVCCVLLPAAVEAWELLLELLGTTSYMLFALSFPLTDLRSQLCLNLQILNKTINEFVLRLSNEVGVQSLGERAFELAFIDFLDLIRHIIV